MTSKPASSKSAGKRAAEARGRDAGGGGGGAFAKWLRDNKVELDGVEVARFARTGRGVRATRDLRVGEVVVSVPDDAVLTVDACAVKKELGEFVGDGDDEAPSPRLDKELLVIAVMCEMCAGKSSAWCEYLETVHEAVRVGHSVLAWDDEQVTALFGTDAWRDAYENDDETLDLPMMTEEHFENVVTLFFKLFPKLASGLSVEALRELHFAATAMVAGYSFTLGDDEIQAMVPFWDMLNHAPPCEASVRLHHDQKNGCLQMITVRGVKEGRGSVQHVRAAAKRRAVATIRLRFAAEPARWYHGRLGRGDSGCHGGKSARCGRAAASFSMARVSRFGGRGAQHEILRAPDWTPER